MSVVLFFLILVALIIGHEFGHFIFAKRAGMRVPEFGIGFPPKLWGKKVGETEYTINALPFGGFVRIVGEDGDADDDNAFQKKSKLSQATVLFAGPFANAILGIGAFWIAFMIGVPLVLDDTDVPPPDARVMVVEVLPESPAALAGLLPGDTLLSAKNDSFTVPITGPLDLQSAVSKSEGPVTLTILRSDIEQMIAVTPVKGLVAGEPERYAIGIGSALVGTQHFDPFTALYRALLASWNALMQIAWGLATLIAGAFTLSASIENLSGPVGIAALVGDASSIGAGYLFSFIAIISLNLALLNLLPLPALDGGRLLFLAIETARGKALPKQVAETANTLGFALLIALMLAVTWNDIVRLFG